MPIHAGAWTMSDGQGQAVEWTIIRTSLHTKSPTPIWQDHELMHRFRGRECDAEPAEAHIRLDRRGSALTMLPGLTPH